MLQKIQKASQLSAADWASLIRAWILLLFFDVALRTSPFPRVQIYAAHLASRQIQLPGSNQSLINSLKIAVDRASYHHLYPMTCLRRALTLQKMLAQRNIATELKIGVQKTSGQFSAHAWLEFQGQPLGEPEKITEKFKALEKAHQ